MRKGDRANGSKCRLFQMLGHVRLPEVLTAFLSPPHCNGSFTHAKAVSRPHFKTRSFVPINFYSTESSPATICGLRRRTLSPTIAMSQPSPSTLPVRDDCWSEDATFTLIEAWGERHLDLNRGNLRHKHWQEVADAVNSRHGHDRKSLRTDFQCKNRIDTLKKKYKIEKAKIVESDGSYICTWPYLSFLDDLIGNKPSTTVTVSNRKASPVTSPRCSLFLKVPVAPRSGTKKRRSTHVYMTFGDSYLRRDANSKEDEGKDGMVSENSRSLLSPSFRKKEAGYGKLAQAIGTITDIYERVEVAKQRHIVELEMQRMQFTKDLEYQRMQLLMEMHLQIQNIKRARRTSGADYYS